MGRVHRTLKDVEYQLGLPIDGEPVSGCLSKFQTLIPDGAGRPRWEWFGVPPDDASKEMITRHARAYIMKLLSTALFGDKTVARVHLRNLCRTSNKNVVFVDRANDPGPSADFLRRWFLAENRILAAEDAFHQLPHDEIHVEAMQRQTAAHPQWPQCVDRRRGGRGRREGKDAAPSQQTQSGAGSIHAHEAGTSTQAEVPSTPQSQQGVDTPTFSSPSQAFLAGHSSLGFQAMMEQILLPGDEYRPEFDGPPQHICRVLRMFLFPPASLAPGEHHDQSPARGRGRRIPRRRGCDTVGHI
ncbi:hypothetical protein PIB30_041966 [Stylosanthes scabra]|uniref:Uncharacterized protein n=1 Tax=Stylosanthes scabra TaxID=79078 RepID=A0ABU6VEG6_9FABA|nr:hypothetical protein [Stylosanthes scabra]